MDNSIEPQSTPDAIAKCYLCEQPLGKPCELICEKGPNIVVCEDCYEDALGEFHDRQND